LAQIVDISRPAATLNDAASSISRVSMRSFSRNLLRSSNGRHCVAMLLLSAFVVTSAGIPLPLSKTSMMRGEIFPCAMNRCGCDSAERCWRSCCCHTLAERLAWARRHGVRPPAFALAKARAAGLDLAWLADASQMRQSSSRCCAEKPPSGVPASCGTNAALAHSVNTASCRATVRGEAQPDNVTGENEWDSTVAWRALACHGHVMNWLAAVPTFCVPCLERLHDLPLTAWLSPTVSDLAEGVSDSPAVPPPERA
jgi:hypothetical protein